MDASIQIDAFRVEIVGHPTVEQWGAAYTQACQLGHAATWARTDLIGWAEDEQPFGDDYAHFLSADRVSYGTIKNDRRRYNRFPPDHDLRRLAPDLSPSHFDAAAPLDDVDAEQVLIQAAHEKLGREWVRTRVRDILNTPTPVVIEIGIAWDERNRVFVPTENPPEWVVSGEVYTVKLKAA